MVLKEKEKMALKILESKIERVLYYSASEKTFRRLMKSVNKNQIIGLTAQG